MKSCSNDHHRIKIAQFVSCEYQYCLLETDICLAAVKLYAVDVVMHLYDNQGNKVDIVKQNECAFCRTVFPISEKEAIKRDMKRVEAGDPMAMYNVGCLYRDGDHGLPQDYTKALEYWHRAGELGNATSYNNIGMMYATGTGVEEDMKKAVHYYELAAMRGNALARHNLGYSEKRSGNYDRALKHYMIAIRDGYADSLRMIKQMYQYGETTKEKYTNALQSYQANLGEIKSEQRDKAAAARNLMIYY